MTFLFAALFAVLMAGCTGQDQTRAVQSSGSAVADSTSPAAAVAWIRSYYAAINEHRYDDAYAHWEQGGQASGKTLDEFRNGFGETENVQLTVGSTGTIGAAAGSRYIEIPVRIDARDKSGAAQTFAGTYTLRLSIVDGATPEQRSWHIYSAAIHRESP